MNIFVPAIAIMGTDKLFTREEINAIRSIPMNFIVGKERSGTTLLQLMLNAHSSIIAPPESRFIILLFYRYRNTVEWTEPIITRFCNDLYEESLFRNFWGIDKIELQQTLIAFKEILTFPSICKLIFHLSAPGKKDVHVFFDKNPLYYYFLPELNRLFPEAKYIHIVRDYRANLVSHQKAFLVKRSTDIAYRWMKVNMLIEDSKKQMPEKYFMLTYESLVEDPDKKMEEICRFLNLPFEATMAHNHQSSMYSQFNKNNNYGFRRIHQTVFKPIDKSFIDSWKGKISPHELLKVETLFGEFAETMYGYKPVNNIVAVKKSHLEYFIMELRYHVIKTIFRGGLANFWFYLIMKKVILMKRKIWRIFE